jgi:hypothetical protein
MWIIAHIPEGRKRVVEKTFLTKPEVERYISRLRKQAGVSVGQKVAWGVFRMRRYGGWSLLKTFDNPDSAKRLVNRMTAKFITVKWRKI